MYKKYFGLKERPFHLTPNPAFLYLSKSHEEALAHLTYALSQGDGFVEIIGEVGTGKTTLCRTFLADLDDSTDAAYIFNPKLDAIQLLKAINDEFAIDSTADNAKDLIDSLNAFLMQSKSEGKKVILLIDEAQNLTPPVLEQLRLLSNLETTTEKLLQIILVGQPELSVMLDSYELRQLGQRITLNCYLAPLNFTETKEYINHRLHIAASKQTVQFDRTSLRLIYKYAQGIPRRINIVCDRVLLTAFGLGSNKITGKITKMALRELSDRNAYKRQHSINLKKIAVLPLILISIVSLGWVLYPYIRPEINKRFGADSNAMQSTLQSETQKQKKQNIKTSPDSADMAEKQKKQNIKTASDSADMAEKQKKQNIKTSSDSADMAEKQKKQNIKTTSDSADISEKQLVKFAFDNNRPLTRNLALQAVSELWQIRYEKTDGLDTIENDLTFFSAAVRADSLFIHAVKWDFALVQRLNLPVIIRFRPDKDSFSRYLTLVNIKDDKVILRSGEQANQIEISIDELTSKHIQTAYIPWKNFNNIQGTVPRDAPDDSVLALKILLRNIGFQNIPLNTVYDPQTIDAVKWVQSKHGMKTDGVVGVLTKIILYNESQTFDIPHLGNDTDTFSDN
ncbi:AAA family ATPase [Desulfococcaceae bacterium HSG9]|nr:AAA family ATPase [Desulfococcaceae bacterium HSG9]